MGFGGVGAVGAAFANRRFADDERGFGAAMFGTINGLGNGGRVMAIDRVNHIPAIGRKALGRVVDKPRRYLSVNGDSVVVIKGNELVKLPSAG